MKPPLLARRVPAWAAALTVLTTVALTLTVAETVNQRSLSSLFAETISVGSSLTYTLRGVDVVVLTTAAAGNTQGTAIEMAVVLGAANGALTAGDWKYVVEVKESAVASVASGTFKVELFKDGASQGALYMKQATSDGATAEGVTFSWDIGPSLGSASGYKVEVTAV